jgi:heme o synthase
MLRTYYHLIKPGIIYGNAMTLIAGFLLGSRHSTDVGLLLATLGGTSLVIACACVLNNYIDRDIDKKMRRTRKRALVTGAISVKNAMIYAACLGIVGFVLLILFTNILTVVLGAVALFFYVILYGIAKRHSIHGTLVGTVPGALPLVAGYTAATNRLDAVALLLFIIMVFWQLAHFYAIAIYRADEYRAANIPVLPLVLGFAFTKKMIVVNIVAFIIAASSLTVLGYASYFYLFVLVTAAAWLAITIKDYHGPNDTLWARKVFVYSLFSLIAFSIGLWIDAILRQSVYNFNMILLMHIVIALAGLVLATLSFFYPSQRKLSFTYALAALTLLSGVHMVLQRQSHMLEACLSGIAYFCILVYLTVAARQKLATTKTKG